AGEAQPEPGVLGEPREHVIEEAESGGDLLRAGGPGVRIEGEFDAEARLARAALDDGRAGGRDAGRAVAHAGVPSGWGARLARSARASAASATIRAAPAPSRSGPPMPSETRRSKRAFSASSRVRTSTQSPFSPGVSARAFGRRARRRASDRRAKLASEHGQEMRTCPTISAGRSKRRTAMP